MRKLLILLSVAALTLALTPFSTAQAASTYKVQVKTYPKLLDVAPNHRDRVKISGKVTGGPVAGKVVRIFAINTSSPNRTRKHIGSVTLSSSGRFSKKYRPSNGGVYKIEAVIADNSSAVGDTGATYLDAFEWAWWWEFYDKGAHNPKQDPALVAGTLFDKKDRITSGQSYAYSGYHLIHGGGTVTFDTRGYKCKKFTVDIGIAKNASRARSGAFSITQRGRTIVAKKWMKKGKHPYVPTRSTRNKYSPYRTVSVHAYGSRSVVYMLANAKAFCTYPSVND